MEQDLTTGSVFKRIVYFSLPYLLSYFLQTLYGMADLFITGQFYGVDTITAVSNGSQIMHMMTVIIVGLAMGTTVTIGHSVGAKCMEQAEKIIGNTIMLFMGIAVVFTVILVVLVKPIVVLIATPQEAVAGTSVYLLICFIGIPFITAYNIISSIFRGLGDSKSPMYFIGIACVMNIALDYLFMGAFHMVCAQTFSVLVALWVIRRRKTGISLKKSDFKIERAVIGQVLKIGIPVALQDGFIQVAFMIITVIANSRGVSDAAAVGVVEKVISALFIVPSSMLATVSALSAQNLGAGKEKRATDTLHYATVITTIYGMIVAVLIQFIAENVVGIFTSDTTVVTMGSAYIRSYIWDCIFAGIHFSFSGYFAACGKSYIGFLHNIISITFVRVPGSYLASKYFIDTLYPMGLAAPAGSLVSVAICVTAFILLKRKSRVAQTA